MEERCFRLDPTMGVVPIPSDEVGRDEWNYWVDVVDPGPEIPAGWLARFEVEPEAVAMITDLPEVPRVIGVGSVVFAQVPTLTASEHPVPRYVTVIVTPRGVVTLQASHSVFAQRQEDRGSSSTLVEPTAGGVVNELADIGVEQALRLTKELRNRLFELQGVADRSPANLDIGKILDMKRQMGTVQGSFEDQMLCVESLAELQSSTLDLSTVHRRLGSAARSLDHLARRAERGQARLDEIHHHASLAAQETANRRLSTLTIVQAIFVPLTLIAGIYGMNGAALPDTNLASGFMIVLVAMGLVAVGEMLYFWKRSWFE